MIREKSNELSFAESLLVRIWPRGCLFINGEWSSWYSLSYILWLRRTKGQASWQWSPFLRICPFLDGSESSLRSKVLPQGESWLLLHLSHLRSPATWLPSWFRLFHSISLGHFCVCVSVSHFMLLVIMNFQLSQEKVWKGQALGPGLYMTAEKTANILEGCGEEMVICFPLRSDSTENGMKRELNYTRCFKSLWGLRWGSLRIVYWSRSNPPSRNVNSTDVSVTCREWVFFRFFPRCQQLWLWSWNSETASEKHFVFLPSQRTYPYNVKTVKL